MEFPINAALYGSVFNPEIWTKQGTAFIVGGAFTTVSGIPSQQLQASLNLTEGYFNGCMLANSAGNGSGRYAGQVVGALINFDPSSTDTGQAVWNGLVICDAGLKFPLPLLDLSGSPYVFNGTIQVASPLQGWVLREQYLYGPGTPSTDVALVNTAVTTTSAVKTFRSQMMNSSGGYEVIFAY